MKLFTETEFGQNIELRIKSLAIHFKDIRRDDREDLEQELRIWAFQHAEEFRQRFEDGSVGDWSGYVCKSAYREYLSGYMRLAAKSRHEHCLDDVAEILLSSNADSESKIVLLVTLRDLIEQLSAADQEILGLHLTGSSNTEIGCSLGLPTETVKKRLQRATLRLKELGARPY